MKISEMTNDQATDAMIRISGPFENITNDDEVIEALDKIAKMRDIPLIRAYGMMIPIFATIGLKKHKQDLYEIVAALTMQPVSSIGKMNFKETVDTLKASYDEVLHDFFTHTVTAGRISVKR